MMDYIYGKFSCCSFSHFGFVCMDSLRHTDTDADDALLPRLSSAWVTNNNGDHDGHDDHDDHDDDGDNVKSVNLKRVKIATVL